MKHVILIGFKNAGKSSIGGSLALKLGKSFVDLDDEIVRLHQELKGEDLSCREIMKQHGDSHFRKIEHEVLKNVLNFKEEIILSLGGGTPMREDNRPLLMNHIIVHITAPKSIIFERIMINGRPAFFPENEDPFETFKRLFAEREPIFEGLAKFTIQNTGSVDDAVLQIENNL